MSGQISKYGVRLVVKHPLHAAQMGNMLLGSTVKLVVISRQAAQAARRAATDRAVHAEGHRAVARATRAAQRARQVGLGNVLNDKRAISELRLATVHASKAANLVLNPRPRRLKRTVVLVVGGGAAAGAAYAGWKLYATPSRGTDTNGSKRSDAASPVTHSPPNAAVDAADAPAVAEDAEAATDTEKG
jgi:hypothetical protein